MLNVASRPAIARWDRAGIVVSTACAVHCVALPVLAGLLPFLGLRHFVDERLEWTFVATTAVIGVVSHSRAYWRHHRHLAPGVLFAAGILLIVGARLLHLEGLADPAAATVGGAFAITAHALNLRWCRCCQSCADYDGATHGATVPRSTGRRNKNP